MPFHKKGYRGIYLKTRQRLVVEEVLAARLNSRYRYKISLVGSRGET
jgi:hypothetical protein